MSSACSAASPVEMRLRSRTRGHGEGMTGMMWTFHAIPLRGRAWNRAPRLSSCQLGATVLCSRAGSSRVDVELHLKSAAGQPCPSTAKPISLKCQSRREKMPKPGIPARQTLSTTYYTGAEGHRAWPLCMISSRRRRTACAFRR